MIIGQTLISFLLPLQLYAHKLENWHPQADALVRIACNSAGLIGLPSMMNQIPVINHNPELQVRAAAKEDKPLKRRKLFVLNLLKNTNTFNQ